MDIWNVPYNKRNTTKQFTFKKKGVYFIRDLKTKDILYIGMSCSCLYKTMYRHFQSWDDHRRYRAVFDRNTIEVKVIILEDCFEVKNLEKRMILKYRPEFNKEKYDSYVSVCNEEGNVDDINDDTPF